MSGLTFSTSWMCQMVCLHPPPDPVISIGNPCIFLWEIPIVTKVRNGTTLRDEPVSTRALLTWTSFIIVKTYIDLLWSGYWTSMSSSVKLTALVVSRKAWLAWASTVKQWDPDKDAMPTMASIVAVLASGVSPNWLNSERSVGLLCSVLMECTRFRWYHRIESNPIQFFIYSIVGVSIVDIMGSSSSLLACLTTTTIPFPLSWWGRGFFCTP